jgi:hypothetical protein
MRPPKAQRPTPRTLRQKDWQALAERRRSSLERGGCCAGATGCKSPSTEGASCCVIHAAANLSGKADSEGTGSIHTPNRGLVLPSKARHVC